MKKNQNENQMKKDEMLSIEGQPLKDSEECECKEFEVACECKENVCECDISSRECDICDSQRKVKNIEILQNLYRNTDMAKKAVEFLMPKTREEDLLKMLSSHYEAYDDLSNKITYALTSRLIAPNTSTGMAVCMLRRSIDLKTIFNKSNTHIADMLIKGNNMGITSLNKMYNNVQDDIDKDVENLLKELLSLEQKCIDELKVYL
ncbi:MAG: hypothetical protein IKD20_06230 [Clostridia bacterium]|nr:hypothetical protein [Clostridia bacterium]